MKLKENNSNQKLRGVYYTPSDLADGIMEYFKNQNFRRILEPSCGDGVFIESLKSRNMLSKSEYVDVIEIDNLVCVELIEKYKEIENINVINEDFFDFYERNFKTEKYDLIIGNPPYIRYQYLTSEQRMNLSDILISHGMKANKLINAWVGFLVACIHLLNENGKIAFVIPAEIMQVVYAEELRFYLSENLTSITLITFEKLVFSDIEQEVIVLIGEKSNSTKSYIRTIQLNNLDDLSNLEFNSIKYQKLIHSNEKWTRYFTNQFESDLIQSIKNDHRFCNFSDIALINVGITTGNNNFFSVDRNTANEYNLAKISLPLIGRSTHAKGIFYTINDWEKNVKDGKKAQLVIFPDIPFNEYDDKHIRYIMNGEKNKDNIGYKCAIRDRWYIIPSIWSPDAFFLRRNNLYPKFVLNSCNAVSTDTMHRIRFKNGINHELALLSYYNSISFAFTELCGRSYGGGVLEILPSETDKILLPKIENLDNDLMYKLLDYINNIVQNNEDIELALELVDNEILVKHLGINKDVCVAFRVIWLKLRKRRLGRGTLSI